MLDRLDAGSGIATLTSFKRHCAILLALIANGLFGCAETSPASTAVCAETGLDDGGQAVSLSSEVPVCGEGGVGFAAQQVGGGRFEASVLNMELGWFYVVIDPSCEFVAYAHTDPIEESLGTAYAGRLTSEQARELDDFLSLQAWSLLESEYGWGGYIADAPDNHYAWGDRQVALRGLPLPAPPTDFPHDLRSLAGHLFVMLKAFGSPVCGPIRYTLQEVSLQRPAVSSGGTSVSKKPPVWPLDAPPAALAAPEGVDFEELPVHVARDDDAARLRDLRERYLAGEFGGTINDFILIMQPDGSAFTLYARDVVAFEQDGEPHLPWTAFGSP